MPVDHGRADETDVPNPGTRSLSERALSETPPFDLAARVVVELAAQVGHVLLRVLDPHPWYESLLRHRAGDAPPRPADEEQPERAPAE
jgi:hypothetical protein